MVANQATPRTKFAPAIGNRNTSNFKECLRILTSNSFMNPSTTKELSFPTKTCKLGIGSTGNFKQCPSLGCKNYLNYHCLTRFEPAFHL